MSRHEASDVKSEDNALTITFYSTSPPDESKSKYPKTNKTSYRIAEPKNDTLVRTTFGFDAPSDVKPKRMKSNGGRGVVTTPKSTTLATATQGHEGDQGAVPLASDPPVVRTRSGRVTKEPVRYEPKEKVLDDYDDSEEDYDSDDSLA